ncbi:hypothetical protein [Actinokineospora spheciospongiae]|uniref:hypothetical protein n=1 Tax=Actinokineospora spheciospongiae TaxID=909613 RepID=UPI000D9F6086|nr:hypothetical protein [Actinokineospora spheciospongiae]PWW63337.1 hypothetical protein DFQ13_104327 [Actinokineospora spheciospongiae]
MSRGDEVRRVRRGAGLAVSPGTRRVLLVVLGVVALGIGGWAYFAPEAWYGSFPGFGLRWLPVLGPYNQHLSSDVGALYLGFAVLTLLAASRAADTALVRATGAAWLVFNVFHTAYHLRHLDMHSATDNLLNAVSSGAFLLISAALLLPLRRGSAATG